jgi:hypothetical protein
MSSSPIASSIAALVGHVSSTSVTEFVCTNGQTTFSVSYTVGDILVFLNGILLDNGVDYAASNGTSVVLTNGAATDDVLTTDTGKVTFTTTNSTAFATQSDIDTSVSSRATVDDATALAIALG